MTTSMRLPRTLSWGVQRRIHTCGERLPTKLYNSEHGISSTITYVDHCESYEGAWVVRAQKKSQSARALRLSVVSVTVSNV